MASIAEIITDRFIAQLERGVVPWRKPWKTVRPFNGKTKRAYNGVNALLLGMAGYTDPRWMTFRQVLDLGGQVRKGEHGMPIIFFKMIPDKKNLPAEGEPMRHIPLLRHTTAFNVEQCDNLRLPPVSFERPIITNEDVDAFVSGLDIAIETGAVAAYEPVRDTVILPARSSFEDDGEFYSTCFHELVHATAHPSRLGRFDESLAIEQREKEELIAEIGSSLLRCELGIETSALFENSAAYVDSWIRVLRADSNLIMSAARKAEDAVAWLREHSACDVEAILGEFFEEDDDERERTVA